MSFSNLGLSQNLLKAIADLKYTKPTPIQEQAIPIISKGHDVLGAAQTGTGKTAGFTLPILQRIWSDKVKLEKKQIRVLILAPTRELAAQVAANVNSYGKYMKYSSVVIFGGVGIYKQLSTLKKGVDIAIATPGRLLDIYSQKGIDFSKLEILVLDEADRMLDMGFIHDIKKLLNLMPKKKQTLLFSATFSKEIKNLSASFLNKPVLVEVAKQNTTAEKINQIVHPVDRDKKRELLAHLIKENNWQQVLVFIRTKHGADRLSKQLNAQYKIKSTAFHSNKSQAVRTKALKDFKDFKIQVLVATDIAARGIDIENLPHVVNYELPNVPEDYVHRIGRTGRAGLKGEAVSLVSTYDSKLLRAIEKFIKSTIKQVPIKGFEINQELKTSTTKNNSKTKDKNKYKDSSKSRNFKNKKRATGNKYSHSKTKINLKNSNNKDKENNLLETNK